MLFFFEKNSFFRVTNGVFLELTNENCKQESNRSWIPNWKAMKTFDFKSFAKDAIRETELNYLKGGVTPKGDPVDDLVHPPEK